MGIPTEGDDSGGSRTVVDEWIWLRKVWMIQHVEELAAKLKILSLSNRECFPNGTVECVHPGPYENIPSGIPKGVRLGQCKCTWIEPQVWTAPSSRQITIGNPIWPDLILSSFPRNRSQCRNIHRQIVEKPPNARFA